MTEFCRHSLMTVLFSKEPFTASKVSILAIVGVGVYNVSATDAFLRSHARESVLYLARTKPCVDEMVFKAFTFWS